MPSSPSPSELKPIKLYGDWGINPCKVAIVLAELGLPYETVPVAPSEVKSAAFVAVNPNGRVPAIEDPNAAGLTLWESGAILEYLVERYDGSPPPSSPSSSAAARKLSFAPGTPDAWRARQWLHFQASGQGPYYGQATWFRLFVPEPVPLASERYAAEVRRVSGVVDGHLARQAVEYRCRSPGGDDGDGDGDGPWIVGGRFSYIDVAFAPWQVAAATVLSREEYDVDDFPHLKAWLGRLFAREAVRSTFAKFRPKE